MRTLSEILNAAKSGAAASDAELRYALCAFASLSTFDGADLREMAAAEKEGRQRCAWRRYEESFNRWKAALAKSPKEWLGWNNDPENPEYQKRRGVANKIWDEACEGKLPKVGT